jgi:hypothetical protein
MGYMRHHAIVVTSWNNDEFDKVWAEVSALADERTFGHLVSPVVGPAVNGYRSFLVAPDGSKEGWDTSDEGDAFRDAVCALLDERRYNDGSTSIEYVEVQFGDDDRVTRLIRDNDHPNGDYSR